MTWILVYLAVGVAIFVVLWYQMKINWGAEASDVKLTMIVTPLLWPLVLLFIGLIVAVVGFTCSNDEKRKNN